MRQLQKKQQQTNGFYDAFYWSDSNLVHIFTLDPSQKSLREVQQILNSTEGNFHQLVALLNCRGLNKVKKKKKRQCCYCAATAPAGSLPPIVLFFTFAGLH